ncbi:MAG: cytochrome c biogenesis protein CcsA [Coriobacteriia bacterium]|nr:cytochrome c biogenesis protein CcsA [Coriobacteriia bacterium]
MSMIGLMGLLIAFAAIAISLVCLVAGQLMENRAQRSGHESEMGNTLLWGGRIAVVVTFVALLVCCGVLAYCFIVEDFSIQYVLDEHSSAAGPLAWLYKLSGLWAGRSGSLLFWAWLIALFNAVVSLRRLDQLEQIDNIAVAVSQAVLACFVGMLLFSESNMPFTVTDSAYYDSDGALTAAASLLGMNTLLEHWAMAIHPPTLFVGYAGLTIPFAYAVSALITGDVSKTWVQRSTRITLISWLFLTVGIGLGALWAYTVLGWGGYWGWDPVENASLLSWLVTVALVHCFTVYRQRGAFRGWAVLCACLAFAFVIVGTFISRSGLVQSVHAFEGDPVSLALFGALIVVSVLVGIVGVVVRRKQLAAQVDVFDSMFSRAGMYFINSLFMVLMAVLLAYMTISSALPSFLPLGGQALTTGSYDFIARPLGILYLLVMALCPLLGWSKTGPRKFLKKARVPGVCALVLFVVLMVYFFTTLSPAYDAIIAGKGSAASELLDQGPEWFFKGLTVVGFAVASLLFFNALVMLVKNLRIKGKRISAIGGSVAHVGMAVILVGLIGSSMYVTEKTGYLPVDETQSSAETDFEIDAYALHLMDTDATVVENGDYVYTARFQVYKDGALIGEVTPSVELVPTTQQQKLNAAVLGFQLEDLFVVYQGANSDGTALSLDVRINRLVSFVWVGFFLLVAGMVISSFGRRREGAKVKPAVAGAAVAAVADEPAASAATEPEPAAATEPEPAAAAEPAAVPEESQPAAAPESAQE